MSLGVRSVGIYVGDQDRAKEFWTQVMGFDLLQDRRWEAGRMLLAGSRSRRPTGA
jgi:catechol 2,3-dioxygenase-like lactoylglutathione lyase family enzyme